jgi:hypothetical protein
MDAISVTGFGDRGSARFLDIVVISLGRRPQSVHALRARTAAHSLIQPRRRLARNPQPARTSWACSKTSSSPIPEIGGRVALSSTASTRAGGGTGPDLGRRPELRHPSGCAAGVRCRLRYGAAGRWRRRNAFAIGVARAIPAGKGSGPTAAVRVHRARFLERCRAPLASTWTAYTPTQTVTPRHIRAPRRAQW